MLINKIKGLFSSKFNRNLGWLGAAELVRRVFRLATTVILARAFTIKDFAMLAAIYATFDIASTFSLRVGIGAKIIQAKEEELELICNTAYWLNWIMCLALFIIQFLAAYPIANYFQAIELVWPLRALTLIYLIYPLFLVQSALIERENRLEVRAWCYAVQTIVSNVLIVSLAILGWGIWSAVIGMIFSYLPWIVINNLNHSWRPSGGFSLYKWREIAHFGVKMIGVELLNKLRLQIDYIIIGGIPTEEEEDGFALGLYFWAFNAGLGISQSILQALASAWYPHFCQVRQNLLHLRKRYFGSFKTIAMIVVPLVILQTTLARFYVPIVFGEKWIPGIPILILVCISAIPIALSRSTSQLLQSLDKATIDLKWNLIFTVIFAGLVRLSAQKILVSPETGIIWVAATVLITQAIGMPLFSLWVNKHVFGKDKLSKANSNQFDSPTIVQMDEQSVVETVETKTLEELPFGEEEFTEELTKLPNPIVEESSKFTYSKATLFHHKTSIELSIPPDLQVVSLGRMSDELTPDLDLGDFPHSEIISRLHAQIHHKEDNYYLEDSNSANGTYLNNKKLVPGRLYELKSGDRIDLGKYSQITLVFRLPLVTKLEDN